MSRPIVTRVLLPVGIVVIGVLILLVLKATRPSPPRRSAQVPRPLVRLYEVPATAPVLEVAGFGTVRAKRKISLVPQVSGEVVAKARGFEPGEFFTAGEVLLRIDDTDYRLAAERALAEVARAEYSLALAKEEAAVARREWEEIRQDNLDGTSRLAGEPSSLVLHEPQLNLARAELAAARAAREQAHVNLKRCRITAPFDGRVLATTVDVGQYIRAGTAIGTIYATDVAEVTVPLPDADLSWIILPGPHREGDTPAGQDGAEAIISADFAGGSHQWQGRVARLGGAIDEQSRMVPVVVEIADPYRPSGNRPPLVEGMFVEVRIAGEPPPGSVAIPRTALRDRDRAWVVDYQGVLEIREVTVARTGIEQAVITSGLRPGDKICLSSLQVVSNGMLVRIAPQGGTP